VTVLKALRALLELLDHREPKETLALKAILVLKEPQGLRETKERREK
jgi:hypothetical protein